MLIDGGHLRARARVEKLEYTPCLVEAVAHACIRDNEDLFRVLYYDCPPFLGIKKLPVSRQDHKFERSDNWLKEIASTDLFAVRMGILKFRGWKPKNEIGASNPITDDDFYPDFEQKGVDMRIGLDMATLSQQRSEDRIILITNDTDCVPAMKHVRKAGLQIVLVTFPKSREAAELAWHSDFVRRIAWPSKN